MPILLQNAALHLMLLSPPQCAPHSNNSATTVSAASGATTSSHMTSGPREARWRGEVPFWS
eukprot:3627977-Lingulodinium_polyedra.AAC.1